VGFAEVVDPRLLIAAQMGKFGSFLVNFRLVDPSAGLLDQFHHLIQRCFDLLLGGESVSAAQDVRHGERNNGLPDAFPIRERHDRVGIGAAPIRRGIGGGLELSRRGPQTRVVCRCPQLLTLNLTGGKAMTSIGDSRFRRASKPFVGGQESPETRGRMEPDVPHVGSTGGRVHPELEAAIQRARGSGRPLARDLQGQMAGGLGCVSSGVRVHIGPEADRLSCRLGAQAFTIGSDIFFRRGAYDPASVPGRELIAHELVHVVQQAAGRVGATGRGMTVRPADDALEREADALARHLLRPSAEGALMPLHLKVAAARPRHLALRPPSPPPVIQRTAAGFVNWARNGMNGWTTQYRPMNCHEAVLGWLLKAEGFTHPWQLMRQIAITQGVATVGPWMARVLYTPKFRLSQGHINNAAVLQPGDILFTHTGNFHVPLHSLALVAGPPNAAIRGFNNQGTFGMNHPAGAYDANDVDITAGALWHGDQITGTFGSTHFGGTGNPLCRVRYQAASQNLQNALQHWQYSFWRTPGWQHTPQGLGVACPAWCPH
jgi:hypothetical protein